MVKVKLFGLFRLDTGLKELEVKASYVRELYPILLAEAKRVNPSTTVTDKDIDGCIVIVNQKSAGKNTRLYEGDTVMLMSPVCGG